MTDSQFTQYYNSNYNALMAFAKRFTKNQFDAEDLVQETAVKAYRGRNSFKQGSNFKSWAFTILRNSFITKYNRKRRRNEVSAPVEDLIYAVNKSVNSINNGEAVFIQEAISKSMNSVSDKCRVPFQLYVRGYRYEEIAEQLNIPVGTVKSRINFTRNKLKSSSILQDLRRA